MQFIRVLCLTFVLCALAASPSRAAGLIRDADIEYGLGQMADPILRAAGLSPSQVRILVINDSSLNAFVADTQHIFIHSGLILKLKSAKALQAVIAHEAAHISNGHLTRRAGNLRSARTAAGLGMILAAAAAAAGNPEAGAGIAFGTSSSAMRRFLSHSRAEEASADQSSVRYMLRAGVDPRGAVEVQEIFRGQEALSAGRQDPYTRSHPLTRDRLRALEGFVAAYAKEPTVNSTMEYWFARTKGKLSAFKRAPKWTLRRAAESPSKDIEYMRLAAAYHRQSNAKKAVQMIDQAIALRPKDPFLRELKGQIQLESRQAKAAVATYRTAVKMAGSNALILGGYGRALLANGQYKTALPVLEKARARDYRDLRILRDLAVTYSKLGKPGMASVVTAERYALQGRLKDAAIHAKRAEALLPNGSGPWRRAQDVLSAARNAKRK